MSKARGHVCEGLDARLEGGIGVFEHGRVEADPCHDSKASVSNGTEVDASSPAVDRHLNGPADVERDVEVDRQQIAGATREDRQRHVATREGSRASRHGAVTPKCEDQRSAPRDGLRGDPLTGVGPGRFDPFVIETPGRQRLLHPRAFRDGGRSSGGGVEHDDGTRARLGRSGRGLSHGMTRAFPVRKSR